jgi:hypothetical protein
MPEILTLAEVSKRIGVSTTTLRIQAENGVLRGIVKGGVWLTTPAEADRYAREHKGKPGRKRKRNQM